MSSAIEPATADAIWDRLDRALTTMAAAIRSAYPRALVEVTRLEAAFFPLGGTLAVSRDADRQEDVVVSIDGQTSDGRLRLTADIACGDGHVLADGPSLELALSGTPDLLSAVEPWIVEIEHFLEHQLPLVLEEAAPDE
jgi:hypothetical protein